MKACWGPVVVAFPIVVSTILLLLLLLPLVSRPASAAYVNFTVGGSEGWTPNPTVNYTTWASGNNFSLGDYLIFNYAKPEYDVIRTYNETLYETCDYFNTSDGDFDVWGEPGITNFSAIPLVQIGSTYFFCGVNNSIFCESGMKFAINVSEGDGLPSNLVTPPPSSPSSPSQPTSPNNNTNNQGNRAPHNLPHLMALSFCATLLPLVVSLSS